MCVYYLKIYKYNIIIMGRPKKRTEEKEKSSDSDSDEVEIEQENIEIIDLKKNIFNYNKKKFMFVNTEKGIYLKGKEVATFLEYENTNRTIQEFVKDKYKMKLSDLLEGGTKMVPPLKKLNKNEMKSIYISISGLYQLVMNSKKPEAEAFQDFVYETVLPSLQEKGSISLTPQISFNTSFVNSFHSTDYISNYMGLNTTYLGIIGLYDNKILGKFGMSGDIYNREFRDHKQTFGDSFKIIYILHTDNNKVVEDIFKKTILAKKLNVELEFNGKLRKELFLMDEKFNIDEAKKFMQEISEKNPLPGIKERDNKIKELEYNNEKEIILVKEKTKQMELETKQKEIDIKQKEIDANLQIRLKEIELENNKINLRSKELDIQQLELNEDVKSNPKRIRAQINEDKRSKMKEQIEKLVELGNSSKDRILKCDILALFSEYIPIDTHVIFSILKEMGIKSYNAKEGKNKISACYYTFIKLKKGVKIPKNKHNNSTNMNKDELNSEILKHIKVTGNFADRIPGKQLEELLLDNTSQNIKSIHKALVTLGVKRYQTTRDKKPFVYYCNIKPNI